MRKLIKQILKEEVMNYKVCSHFTDSNQRQLCYKLNSMSYWLVDKLGMKNVINDLLSTVKVVSDLTDKYQAPLKMLHDTGKYPDIKLVNGTYTHSRLIDAGLVLDDDGEYHYVNKLNTNYSDLSELLTELLTRGGKVEELSNKSDQEIQDFLMKVKPSLPALINKYLQIDELKEFVRNTIGFTAKGDAAEDYASDVMERFGMTKLYQGGNGDFIDMLFGVDLIMDHKGRTIVCQVKSSERLAKSSINKWQYKNVDYFIAPINGIGSGIVIYNKKGQSFKMSDDGKKI